MTASLEPRAAIVGAGLMGRWHADAVRRIGGRVVLIVDPNERARVELGRRCPDARIADALDADDVASTATAAHVCSPLPTHAPLVSALIEAGVAVLVEKPFAETADGTRSLLAHARERGVIVCPVHQFLFQNGVRQLRTWLPELGTVRRIEFSACSAGAGEGVAIGYDDLIAEILPHPLSITSLLLQSPVGTIVWHVLHPAAGELKATASVGETVIDIAISAHGRPTENVVRVIADRGSVTADLYHGFAVRHDGAVSRGRKIAQPFTASSRTLGVAAANLARRAIRAEPAYPGLRDLVRAFYSAVRSNTESPIAPAAIEDVAVARDALLRGLRSRSLSEQPRK
jgi:predicted dehydrogenase